MKTKRAKMKNGAQTSPKTSFPQGAPPEVDATVRAVELSTLDQNDFVPNPTTNKDTVMVILYSILLFFAMTVQTGRMSMILVALALALSIGKTPLKNFQSHLSIPVIGLLAFAVMNGAAAIYSPFDENAVAEFYKFIAAFSMAVILLARYERKHVRGLMWGLVSVCAAIALLCIDLSCSRVLFDPFNRLMIVLGSDYSSVVENSASIRTNGIYNDANLTGAILGTAMPIAIYLAQSSKELRKKALACVLFGISAVSFLVAMSRGAILCFGLSMTLYLLAVGRKNRLSLFFFMLSCGIGVATTALPAMMNMSNGTALPLLLSAVSGMVIFLLDWCVGQRLAEKLMGHGVAVTTFCCGLVVVAFIAIFTAFQLTVPYVFEHNSVLYRAVNPSAGSHTFTGDWDGTETTTVYVYCQSPEEALLGEHTSLYDGLMDTAVFDVPAGTKTVYIQVRGVEGDTIRTLSLSDGTVIPLKYRWLPEAIVWRLQGSLFNSSSFLLRMQYAKDAWLLFTKSPLLGHGLGSTEGLYTSVQPFFYQSLFAHNHILQVMSDMGLLGLMSFMVLLMGIVLLLLRSLHSAQRPLVAAVLSSWVMMNVHSLTEINFSIRAFQCIAFVLLMLAVLLYVEPIKHDVKRCGLVLNIIISLYLALFGGLLQSHRLVERSDFTTTNPTVFLNTMKSYVQRDVFVQEQNKLNFVANALLYGDTSHRATLLNYVEDLRSTGTYTACSGLARYFYLPMGDFEELFSCSRQGILQEASVSDSWNLQLNFYRTEVLPATSADNIDVFLHGVMSLKDMLEDYNKRSLTGIILTEDNQLFLNTATSVIEDGLSADAAYLILSGVVNSISD